MLNLPDNNNTSVDNIYETAHIVRELIKKGFSIDRIHKETGMPTSAIEVMYYEYGVEEKK